ncbi:M24 family metallopeptidase [Kribbella sp. NPDC004138]
MTMDRIPTYSQAERDRRWALARDVMAVEGLDALLVYGEHEGIPAAPFAPDNYFSNDRPGTIVMFFGDADPIQLVWSPMHVTDHIEATKRGDDLWISPKDIRVGKDPAHVAALVREHHVQEGRIGVVGLEPYPPWHILPILPLALYAPLAEEFPKATFKPAWLPLLLRMLPNSDEELALVEYTAAVGDEIAEAMLLAAHPGATDADVLAAGMATGYRRGAQPHILINTGASVVSWGDAPWAYRPQQRQVIRNGDVVMAEVLNSVARRETQSQVAIAVGDVHPDIETAAKIARAGYDVGLETLRPGNTFGNVADAMLAVLEDAGGWNVHPMVHGLNPYGTVCGFGRGLRTFPPAAVYGGLGEVPTVGRDLPLQPGMTFSFEPNCVINGHLVNLGGTVVVGAEDPIELNTFTAQLLRR